MVKIVASKRSRMFCWITRQAASVLLFIGFLSAAGSVQDEPLADQRSVTNRGHAEGFGHGSGRFDWSIARIVVVDSLLDSQPRTKAGELRYAIEEEKGPRIVLFQVAGEISLHSGLHITASQSGLYLAGQSAPGALTIRAADQRFVGDLFRIDGASNIVMSYLRLRLGLSGSPGSGDNVSLINARDILLDHLSISWSNDENIGVYTDPGSVTENVTLQNSLLSEPLSPHSANFLIGTSPDYERPDNVFHRSSATRRFSIHRNVFSHASHRNPFVVAKEVLIANNLTYNWTIYSFGTLGDAEVDYVENILVQGPDTVEESAHVYAHQGFTWMTENPPADRYDINDERVLHMPAGSVYHAGNFMDWMNPLQRDGTFDEWSNYAERVGMTSEAYACDGVDFRCLKNHARHLPLVDRSINPYVIVKATSSLRSNLLAEAGAFQHLDCEGTWVAARDAVDSRVIRDITQRRHALPPEDQDDVGGYAATTAGPACVDTDQDGLPDAYEHLHGLSPTRKNAILPIASDKPGLLHFLSGAQ